MSMLLNKLVSDRGLLKAAVAGAAIAVSVAAQAPVADAPAAPSHIGDSAAQAQTFDALVGFAAVPLSDGETDRFDAERIRLRVSFAGIHIGTIHAGSRYRGPHFKGSLKCVPVPTPAGGVTVKCGLSW